METSVWFLKLLSWLAWIAAVLGVLLITVGIISAWVGRIIPDTESVNFFHAANSFLLGAIFLLLVLIKHKKNKD
jgi:predicted ferric reductase